MNFDPKWLALCTLGVALGAACATVAAAPECKAQSAAQQTTLVELYTSEGCNSCPPADRWLSGLKQRPDVLAAAFHVDYWDRLGWKDRFADSRHTQRQAQAQAYSGAKFSYTPQVLVNGRDWRQWPDLPVKPTVAAVQIALQWQGDGRVAVRVLPGAGAPQRLGLWWALLEDGHASAVKAGENAGVTLRHDHVVRAHGQRAPWPRDEPAAWLLELPGPGREATASSGAGDAAAPRMTGEGGRAARLLVVVTDAASGTPLQAVQLAC